MMGVDHYGRPTAAAVRDRIGALLDDASAARRSGDPPGAWRHLEDAHVLSQPWVRPHVRVHLAMLSLGWSQRDRAEVVGQLARLLLAGPGSVTGRSPIGNTGRSNVSAFEPMPVRDDLAQLLGTARVGADWVDAGADLTSMDGMR